MALTIPRTQIVAILLTGCLTSASAQEPTISGMVPGALKPGGPQAVVFTGGNLQGARGLWTSVPVEATLAADVPENGKAADKVTLTVNVPAETPVGVHALRVVTDHGTSLVRLCVVDDLPSVAQAGAPTAMAMAQPISVPCAVDGAVAILTTQFYKFTAAAGQTLSFEVLAHRIGSALDPTIRILDGRGRELAFNDDAPGIYGDSRLTHTFRDAGEYTVELRDVRYQGGAFRLRIGDFPCVSTPYPLAVQAGTQASIQFAGSSIEGLPPVTVAAPTEPFVTAIPVSVRRPGGQSSGFASLTVAAQPQFLEQEPNNAPEEANRLSAGQDINGRFETAGDVDRFVFAAKKDQTLVFSGIARQVGSPADLVMKVVNAQGGQVAAVEDTGTGEGILTAKFPADGDYALVVEELSRRGGPDLAWRVAVADAAAPFTLAASTDTLNIPAGGTAAVTVTATRPGFAGPIELSLPGLPAGLTASRTVLGPGRTVAVMTVTAAADAPVGSLQAVKLLGTAKIGDRDVQMASNVATPVKTRNATLRYLPEAIETATAAAIAPPAQLALAVDKTDVVFGPHLTATVKVTATRGMGLDEAVTLAVTPDKEGVPANITVAVKPVEKGKNEVEIAITGTDKAPLGEFTVALQGTLKQDKTTVVQPAPALRLILQPVIQAALDPAGGKLARNGKHTVKVNVTRNPAFSGPVTVTLQNLPKGVTATPATIPPEASTADIELTAAEDAAVGAIANLSAKVEVMAGAAKVEAVSGNVGLTVE